MKLEKLYDKKVLKVNKLKNDIRDIKTTMENEIREATDDALRFCRLIESVDIKATDGKHPEISEADIRIVFRAASALDKLNALTGLYDILFVLSTCAFVYTPEFEKIVGDKTYSTKISCLESRIDSIVCALTNRKEEE